MLTGLSPHLIRAWERRYGLVEPTRGSNRYRLYTDEDVRLFRYLKNQVDGGTAIGELAEIGREELLKRTEKEELEAAKETPPSERLIGDLTRALREHDRVGFERKLNGALGVIPFEEALYRFLLPFQVEVGNLWHDGTITVAQEHFGTSQVKQKIYAAINQLPHLEGGPKMVVACPANEWHEIAAMTAAYLCRTRGCRVHYLGPNLPIAELEHYCHKIQPGSVLLSMTVNRSGIEANEMVQELVQRIKPIASVGVGGHWAITHATLLEQEDIIVFPDFQKLDSLVFSLTH